LLHRAAVPPLAQLVPPATPGTIIVGGATRNEAYFGIRRAPSGANLNTLRFLDRFLDALAQQHLATRWASATVAATHGPSPHAALELRERVRAAHVVSHDGHRDTDPAELGVTSRGTPVRVRRRGVEADLALATGCVRSPYFTGRRGDLPGTRPASSTRQNHVPKAERTHGFRWERTRGRTPESPTGLACRVGVDEASRGRS
jgi:hypothetical protein